MEIVEIDLLEFGIDVVVQFLPLVQFFLNQYKMFEPVQNFLNQYKIFWTGSIFFVFGFGFASNKKNRFGTFDLYPPSSLHLYSTYLTYYSLPALPASQPLFFLSQCLPCESWTTDLWFSSGFMSWCLTTEPWRPGCKFPYFLITYTQ